MHLKKTAMIKNIKFLIQTLVKFVTNINTSEYFVNLFRIRNYFVIVVVIAAINTNLHWNALMEGVIRISHLIELVYSQKMPKNELKKFFSII